MVYALLGLGFLILIFIHLFQIAKAIPCYIKHKMDFNDEDMVLIRYDCPNKGQHGVRGPVTGQFYGYHGNGDKFYVYKEDMEKSQSLFVPVK